MKRIVSLLLMLACCTGNFAFAESPAPDVPPVEMDSPKRIAKIRAVGDIMCHEEQLVAHKKKNGSYDFSSAFPLVKDALSNADYTLGNLELTIGKVNGRGYSGFPTFNAPPQLLDSLKDAGLDMLTLANNHMLDRFENGVKRTLDELDARDIAHVGANRSAEEQENPVIVEVNGIQVGMLAYTEHTNAMERYVDPIAVPYLVNLLYASKVADDVQKLKAAGAEFIVASVHWGTEYKSEPDAATKKAAQFLCDVGVDAILGSHPHQVQPIEWLKSKDGTRRTLVAYSLGNIIGAVYLKNTDAAIILEFTLQECEDGSIELISPNYVPVFLWKGSRRGKGRVIRPVPIGKLWKEPLKQMNKRDRESMKQAYRDIVKVIGNKVAKALDE